MENRLICINLTLENQKSEIEWGSRKYNGDGILLNEVNREDFAANAISSSSVPGKVTLSLSSLASGTSIDNLAQRVSEWWD